MRSYILIFSAFLSSGCVYQKSIVRPDEKPMPINFSSDKARETFECTLRVIKSRYPQDIKQKESTSANLLFINLYRKDYFLSEAAYGNYIIEKTDINKNMLISKEEANFLYKSYFPNHKYVSVDPGAGFLRRIEAAAVAPLCNIHIEN